VLDRLGTGAPQTANFFILYIIFTVRTAAELHMHSVTRIFNAAILQACRGATFCNHTKTRMLYNPATCCQEILPGGQVLTQLHCAEPCDAPLPRLQAFIGRSFALLRPWGLFMSSIRALAARNRGRSGRRRALLIGTYRCALTVEFCI
jgi:hypothetical protein